MYLGELTHYQNHMYPYTFFSHHFLITQEGGDAQYSGFAPTRTPGPWAYIKCIKQTTHINSGYKYIETYVTT